MNKGGRLPLYLEPLSVSGNTQHVSRINKVCIALISVRWWYDHHIVWSVLTGCQQEEGTKFSYISERETLLDK